MAARVPVFVRPFHRARYIALARLGALSNLATRHHPRRTRRCTVELARVYFPRCFPRHLYVFRRVTRCCTSRLASSTAISACDLDVELNPISRTRERSRLRPSFPFPSSRSSGMRHVNLRSATIFDDHGTPRRLSNNAAPWRFSWQRRVGPLRDGLVVFTIFGFRGKGRRTRRTRFSPRTRDSIINYSGERIRPRVKGSFLNARCGLTDSPPCPPTVPPTPHVHHRHS